MAQRVLLPSHSFVLPIQGVETDRVYKTGHSPHVSSNSILLCFLWSENPANESILVSRVLKRIVKDAAQAGAFFTWA
jgi:hypothetical protein